MDDERLLVVKSTSKHDEMMFKSLLVRNPFAFDLSCFKVSNSINNPATSNFSFPH